MSSAASAPRATRREAKERSRQRLIEATLDILRDEGTAGLTTGRVAKAAGLSQPSFYVHFKDMDDALGAAAETIGERIREALADSRGKLRGERSHATLFATFQATLEALLANPTCTAVLLRHRRDGSTRIGRYSGELLASLREDLLRDCRDLGLNEERLPHLELLVDFMHALTTSVVEGFLDGRYEDRETCIEALVRSSVSVYGALESMVRR